MCRSRRTSSAHTRSEKSSGKARPPGVTNAGSATIVSCVTPSASSRSTCTRDPRHSEWVVARSSSQPSRIMKRVARVNRRTVISGETMSGAVAQESFEQFVAAVEPGLRRALVGHLPAQIVPDAVAEAFAYAWEHWEQMETIENPTGYLFRVAQSRSRRRRAGLLPGPDPTRLPFVEPGLGPALRALP